MSTNIMIRVDASCEIGFGHISRCIVLAESIGKISKICFISRFMPEEFIQKFIQAGFEFLKIENDDNFGNILGFYWNRNMKFLSELRYLFVINKYRGLGIGKELLSSCLFNTSKINRKQLWVLENNPSAINLYKKFGYEFDGLVDHIFIRGNNQK
jgi:ribosomal protein S18 acetylase RimI-like enzyme